MKEKASRFRAFAFPIESPKAADNQVKRLRRHYHDASHVAFAWKIGAGDRAKSRASDAGEPSGTAGRPIASAIESAGVTDVLVAVVRDFGGIKLGTAGLARAYREAATQALVDAGNRAVAETVSIVVTCPYASAGLVRRLLHPPEVSLSEEHFGADCAFRLTISPSWVARVTSALEDARLAYRIER